MKLHEIKIDGIKENEMWKIGEDRDAVIRAISVFKDPKRIENVKKFVKKEKEAKKNEDSAIDLIADGNLKEALGL
ncbi:MAG: hypothetical protein CR967_04600 [Proteobacteria bacterium]|nr:MAG: hypothetical protein CR967_04600 [Pseudomonadota bacterium]